MIVALFLLAFLFPNIADATTRYAGLGGSDSNTCAQSQNIATAKLTYASAKACMSPGDTLRLIAGSTFTEQLSVSGLTGTQALPYIITANAGPGTVTFVATGSSSCRTLVTGSTTQWVTLADMTWDGSSCADQLTGNRIDGPNHLTLSRIEIVGFKYHGLYITGASNIVIEESNIHDQVAPTCNPGFRYLGMYIHDGSNITVRRSIIEGNPGGGIQLYPGPLANVTIEQNKIHGNGTCTTTPIGGIVSATDSTGGNLSGIVIQRNEIYGNGPGGTGGSGGGIRLYATGGRTQTGTKILNNTIYGNLANSSGTAYGVKIEAGPTGTIVKNNLVLGNETGQIIDSGSGSIISNNRTTGSITDCTVSTSVFTQKDGSFCVDQGIDVGLAYNGGAPDIGAYETFDFSFCEVVAGDSSTIRVTFTNNAAPPLLPATGATTFTARKDGSGNTVSASVDRVGDGIFYIPVTDSYAAGDAVDISLSVNNITSSSLIGNTTNQPYVGTLTNQGCSNNSTGGPSYVWTQARYELHYYRGLEAAPVILPYGFASTGAAENFANYRMGASGKIRVRFAVTCSGSDCPPTAFFPYYSTGGAYAQIPAEFDSGNIKLCGVTDGADMPANGAVTTEQLSTSGTFIPGGVLFTANAIPTISGMNNGFKTELEYCFAFDSDATGNYDVRLYQQDATALTTYTTTPRLVLDPSAAGGM